MAAWLQFLEQVDFLVCQGAIVPSRDELAHRDDDHADQSDQSRNHEERAYGFDTI